MMRKLLLGLLGYRDDGANQLLTERETFRQYISEILTAGLVISLSATLFAAIPRLWFGVKVGHALDPKVVLASVVIAVLSGGAILIHTAFFAAKLHTWQQAVTPKVRYDGGASPKPEETRSRPVYPLTFRLVFALIFVVALWVVLGHEGMQTNRLICLYWSHSAWMVLVTLIVALVIEPMWVYRLHTKLGDRSILREDRPPYD